MTKKYLGFLLIFSLFLAAGPLISKADTDQNLPETDGIYDVAGHPNLKLRVIIHHGKPADKPSKPGTSPSPNPSLICNLSDPDSSATVSMAGWKMPINWTYRLNPSSVPSSVGKSNLTAIVNDSFAPWKNAVSAVNITADPNTTATRAAYDGQNIISWGRASASALAVTYIWYDTATSTYPYPVVELDTIMNNKYSWAWSDPATWASQPGYVSGTCAYQGVYDAEDILTHELGHWYGLNDQYTSDYRYNTMYGYGYTGQTNADTLTWGDIAGVKLIYH